MRVSDLVGATVADGDGRTLGYVTDVRLAQVGPVRGTLAELEVESLIVSKRHAGSLFGYERDITHGPWLVRRLALWLHREAFLLPWGDVSDVDDSAKRITARRR
jgi:sporulation protein YlmC with PRC-barrel domain